MHNAPRNILQWNSIRYVGAYERKEGNSTLQNQSNNIHTHTHTYVRTYIHTYIDTYMHTYVRTYVRTYMYIYIHIYTHAYMHTDKNHKNDYLSYQSVTPLQYPYIEYL